MTANPSAIQVVGIAKESVAGTYVEPAGTDQGIIPFADITVKPVEPRAEDKALRGSMRAQVWNTYQTTQHFELTLKGPVYAGFFGHILMAAFGTDTKTGAGPYLHTFSVADTSYPGVPTYSLFHRDGSNALDGFGYAGAKLKSLHVTYDKDSLLSYEAVFLAPSRASQTNPASLTVESGSGYGPFPGHTLALTLGGSANKAYEKFGWEFDRDTDIRHTFNGSRNPEVGYITPGAPKGTFSGTAYYDDPTEYNRFANHSQSSLVATIGDTSPLLAATATSPDWRTADVDPGGPGDVQKVNLTGVLKYHATDSGILKVALTNSRSTTY